MRSKVNELTAEEVTVSIPKSELSGDSDQERGEPFIGQERAREALKLGLEVRSKGYNIFIVGPPGTGKRTALKQMIRTAESYAGRRRDIVFVYHFADPDRPRVLYFKPGMGKRFKHDTHALVERVKASVREKLGSPQFDEKKEEILSLFRDQEQALLERPESEDLEDLTRFYTSLKDTRESLEKSLSEAAKTSVLPDIEVEFGVLKETYRDPEVRLHLEEMKEDILKRLYLFLSSGDDTSGTRLARYGVNIVVDTPQSALPPVIYEKNPAPHILYGRIEGESKSAGDQGLDFLNIRAGSLIRSSGGILVLDAEDILKDVKSWQTLKKVIQEEAVEIEPVVHPSDMGPFLKPEPVKVDLKIILIGEQQLYSTLFTKDPELTFHFKILAEFEPDMPMNRESISGTIRFIRDSIKRHGLKPADTGGTAAVIEYSCRLAGHKKRMSNRFSLLEEVLIEADYWAMREGKESIDRDSVHTTLRKRFFRLNLLEERIEDSIAGGEIQVKLEGNAVGRINGLTVVDRGYYVFGKPAVISCRTAPGKEGVVNIEREAGLSGEHHDKGMLMLEGFLKGRYAVSCPLSVYAAICFEQSYGEVDGDSASSAELLALLSSLSGLPLRQDLAVTGSVNAHGEFLPVAGITEKVEGFYRICRKAGLTGSQGVVIPVANTVHLTADAEMAEAVREQQFHIYPVASVDEAMELLTGKQMGKRDNTGLYPEGSINAQIETKLRKTAELLVKYR